MAGTHAHKSPSGAERFHNCAGALALIAALPREQKGKSGPAAMRGTCAHALLEWCLRDRTPPSSYRGRLIELVGELEEPTLLPKGRKKPRAKNRHVFEVDLDMVEGVTRAYEYVLDLLAQYPNPSLTLEGRTNPLPERDDTHGTADVTIDGWPLALHVLDYKNGRLTVEHEHNPQLLSYLLGRAQEFGFDYERFLITIVQPFAPHDEGPVRTFEIDAEGLKEFERLHRQAVERVDEAIEAYGFVVTDEDLKEWADKYLAAGDHCAMCDAAAVCPKFRERLAEEAKADFDSYPVTELYLSTDFTDPERAAQVVRWAPLMKALINQAERYVYNALMAGRKVEGFKLVKSKGHRKWRSDMTPAQVAKKLVADGYMNKNEVAQIWTEPELRSGPQVETLLPKEKRKAFSSDFLERPEGSPRLARAEERGEEVVVDPFAEFTPIVEDQTEA